jgi:DNA repair exonuclease SbcCD ATPase subunit
VSEPCNSPVCPVKTHPHYHVSGTGGLLDAMAARIAELEAGHEQLGAQLEEVADERDQYEAAVQRQTDYAVERTNRIAELEALRAAVLAASQDHHSWCEGGRDCECGWYGIRRALNAFDDNARADDVADLADIEVLKRLHDDALARIAELEALLRDIAKTWVIGDDWQDRIDAALGEQPE